MRDAIGENCETSSGVQGDKNDEQDFSLVTNDHGSGDVQVDAEDGNHAIMDKSTLLQQLIFIGISSQKMYGSMHQGSVKPMSS